MDKIVSRATSNWTKKEGPYQHIVISSRVRLARNLEKDTMPLFQNEEQGKTVLDKVKKAVDNTKFKKRRNPILLFK